MGGKALNLKRIEFKGLYFEIFDELKQKISKYFYRFELIPSYRNKDSFGDMDILCILHENFNIQNIIGECNSKSYIKNGNVLSVEYKDFQIDLIFAKEKFFDTSLLYYSYNDLGNLMGRIANSMNIDIKYGHFGLKKIFYSDNNKSRIVSEHILSTNAKKIFDFLGFSYEKYKKGFNDITDIFKFVMESYFFEKSIFQYNNLNNENRTRNKKRKSYNLFLEYIEKDENIFYDKINILVKANILNEKMIKAYKMYKNNLYKNRLIKFFPEILDFEKEINKRIENDKILNEKFNGNIFMENTGLKGKELGDAIGKFKKKYSNDFLMKKSSAEIIELIKNQIYI